MLYEGNGFHPNFGIVGELLVCLLLVLSSSVTFVFLTSRSSHLPLSILESRTVGLPVARQRLTRVTRSLFFPLCFSLLHFNYCFSCSTVYPSHSLSNLEPGTLSLLVNIVILGGELVELDAIITHSLLHKTVCLSESRGGSQFLWRHTLAALLVINWASQIHLWALWLIGQETNPWQVYTLQKLVFICNDAVMWSYSPFSRVGHLGLKTRLDRHNRDRMISRGNVVSSRLKCLKEPLKQSSSKGYSFPSQHCF